MTETTMKEATDNLIACAITLAESLEWDISDSGWADGSWRAGAGRLSSALHSLSMAWPGCVERQWGNHGPRGGMCQAWRFTARGIEVQEIVTNAR